jgi:hypothetical protein
MADSDIIVSLHLVIPFISMVSTKHTNKNRKNLTPKEVRILAPQDFSPFL